MQQGDDTYYMKALEKIFHDRYGVEYPMVIVQVNSKQYLVGKKFVTKDFYDSVVNPKTKLLGETFYYCEGFLNALNQDFDNRCGFSLMPVDVTTEASFIWGENGHVGYSEMDIMQEKSEEARYGLMKDWCSTRGFSIGNVPQFRFCVELENVRSCLNLTA